MYLYGDLQARASQGKPVRVGLIGAGKFGSMFLSQAPTTPGLTVTAIADLDPDGAAEACKEVGWNQALIEQTFFTDDASEIITTEKADVVIEATGNPIAGIHHARSAINNGVHIVMVNVEADVLAGPLLAQQAKSAGVVYSCLLYTSPSPRDRG